MFIDFFFDLGSGHALHCNLSAEKALRIFIPIVAASHKQNAFIFYQSFIYWLLTMFLIDEIINMPEKYIYFAFHLF
jgi:hypothetical protein